MQKPPFYIFLKAEHPSEIYVNRACTLRGRATVLPYYVAPKDSIKQSLTIANQKMKCKV